jgi:hypothetical protein
MDAIERERRYKMISDMEQYINKVIEQQQPVDHEYTAILLPVGEVICGSFFDIEIKVMDFIESIFVKSVYLFNHKTKTIGCFTLEQWISYRAITTYIQKTQKKEGIR